MEFRRSRVRVWLVLVVGIAGAATAAEVTNQGEGVAWLKKMTAASRQLNYEGIIVYQHRNHIETSRVVHYVNSAGGEFEKLETMDGPPREVIRSNDQVICYLPKAKTVLIQERNRGARNFPALLPESLGGITDSYTIRKGEVDRIAGYDCQWISLEPRDQLRYGRRFCAEIASGLPLRAHTVDEKNEPVESFAFSQLSIGGGFRGERVKSRYADKSKSQNWRVERSGFSATPATPGDTGWAVAANLPGFRKVMEAKRWTGGRTGFISQIVLSDGLTAVSVFIEPGVHEPKTGALSSQGAVNIYTRAQGNHTVTVLGEAPKATVMRIADSVEAKPTTAGLQ
jgi:sigma-E factor negative regulatory protein RseB